jgi:hypothetical protein
VRALVLPLFVPLLLLAAVGGRKGSDVGMEPTERRFRFVPGEPILAAVAVVAVLVEGALSLPGPEVLVEGALSLPGPEPR